MNKKPNNIVCGYEISVSIERTKEGVYAVASCPFPSCGHIDESHDHGLGAAHATRITLGKIRTHMIMTHKVKSE